MVSWVVVAPKARSSVGRNGGIHRKATLATVFAAYSFARFARTPSQGKAPLRPVIENYLLVFYGVFTAGQFFR